MGGCIAPTPNAAVPSPTGYAPYNHRRPHTSLDGLTPMAVPVNNAHLNHS
jgi:hypothetical protein